MASLYTTNIELEKPGQGEQDGVWSQTVNRNFDKIDAMRGGVSDISLTSNKTISTSRTVVSEFDTGIFKFSGNLNTIAANRVVTLPDGKAGKWILDFTGVTFGTRI